MKSKSAKNETGEDSLRDDFLQGKTLRFPRPLLSSGLRVKPVKRLKVRRMPIKALRSSMSKPEVLIDGVNTMLRLAFETGATQARLRLPHTEGEGCIEVNRGGYWDKAVSFELGMVPAVRARLLIMGGLSLVARRWVIVGPRFETKIPLKKGSTSPVTLQFLQIPEELDHETLYMLYFP